MVRPAAQAPGPGVTTGAAVRRALRERAEIGLLDVRPEGLFAGGHPLFAASFPARPPGSRGPGPAAPPLGAAGGLRGQRAGRRGRGGLQLNIDQRQLLEDTADRDAFVKAGDVVEPFSLPEVLGGTIELDRLLADGDYVELFVAAEELGFDSAWVAQHHFDASAGRLPSPFTFLAAVAERTRRIRLARGCC